MLMMITLPLPPMTVMASSLSQTLTFRFLCVAVKIGAFLRITNANPINSKMKGERETKRSARHNNDFLKVKL